MIKAAYNVHEEKKKAKGTKENPPTRYYWLWKKCCRAKSVCHVTKAAAAAGTPYSTLAVAFPRDAFNLACHSERWQIVVDFSCRALSRVAASSLSPFLSCAIKKYPALFLRIVLQRVLFYQQTRVSPSLSKRRVAQEGEERTKKILYTKQWNIYLHNW